MNEIQACKLAGKLGVLTLAVGLNSSVWADHITPTQAQEAQNEPVKLGTSGSSREHIVSKGRLFCYTGTLGALAQDSNGNTKYILSNNHVLAKENELLGSGSLEDNEIIQPGLLDQGRCTVSSGDGANQVGTLTAYKELLFGKGNNKPVNYVDAAIAVADGSTSVEAQGAILGIGPLSGATVEPALDMKVQKTGRTTGHTFGTVLAVGVTIDVKYESGTARFADQMRIRHKCEGADFSDSGDSGSQIVSVPDSGDPDSVGLLFAGGDADTFANPMGRVVQAFDFDIVMVPAGSGTDGDTQGAMSGDFDSATCESTGGGGRRGGGRPFNGVDPLGLTIAGEVQARNSDALFALSDVVGHGIGLGAAGEPVIEIYVASPARRAAVQTIPAVLEGVPVRVVETGVIHAF